MTETSRRGLTLRALRIALACVAGFDVVFLAYFVGEARRFADPTAVDPVSLFVAQPWVHLSIAALGLVAVVRFALRPGRLAEAGAVLATLAILSHTHAALEGGPWRHLYYSGLCLLGWALGGVVARRRGAPENESLSRLGAIAMLGAAYANAGVSKLVYGGGIDWLAGHTLRYAVVAQDGLVGSGPLHDLRELVAGTPIVAGVLATATVGFELAGPSMIVGPRTRAIVAIGLVSMHASIYLLTGIRYFEPMFLLALYALPVAGTDGAPPTWGPAPRVAAWVAVALTLVAALAIAREAWPRGDGHHAEGPVRARVGGLSVGAELGGSTIESLDVRDDALVVQLAGPEGIAAFDVTCRSSPHEGPFDHPPLHLFYRQTDRDVDSLAAPADAIAALLETDGDACATLARWIAEPE